ncbi:hypothetical protein EPUS_06254 [Endocarpon pusillum Z07020]|uniref:FAM86 N-terminal domain-containing protein n=1 Tax=Endocarpon pusillum (strain Z07020 / HMAS-L-300199) TaxID=1263415 RepID=U1HFE0_ENDPU|nr:uncharacterized protein EPUS_06254 [Endocarpon pusillum Z07020]ERF68810.1 hypothetical protein EPUS_06254 [Endocarpon pusillum Z07020]
MVQSQIYRYMFTTSGIFGFYLPPANYQRRVLKQLTRRIEGAIRDPDEDDISGPLMEKMAHLSTLEDPSPLETAEAKSVLTYILPSTTETVLPNAVFIEECPSLVASGGNTGLRTWAACLHLATYLATEAKHLVLGKSVLELGAGRGLLSIICAGPLSAAYVLATDGDRHVHETITRNVNLNPHLARKPGRQNPLDARVLEWDSSAPLGSLLPSKGGNVLYDTILGADITYDPDSLEPLASTLSGLAELCPTANIVIAATIRNVDTFDIFLAHCLEQGLSVYDIDFRCPPFELQEGLFHSLDPPIRIVRIKKEG